MFVEHCCPGVRQLQNGTPSGLPFQPHEQATRHPGEHRCTRHRHARTIGDPLTDVALMCVYRNPALHVILGMPAAWTSPRLPSPDALAEAYARRSGRDLSDWPFYLALSHLKLAVIAEGISHRAQAGADAGRDAARAAEAVPPLVAAGPIVSESDDEPIGRPLRASPDEGQQENSAGHWRLEGTAAAVIVKATHEWF